LWIPVLPTGQQPAGQDRAITQLNACHPEFGNFIFGDFVEAGPQLGRFVFLQQYSAGSIIIEYRPCS
jgi:hypothetical protein